MFRCRKTNKPHDELAYQQSLARRRAPGPRQPVKTQWKTVAGFREINVAKDRRQIESFFKSLKQLLRVKAFVGTSPNALKDANLDLRVVAPATVCLQDLFLWLNDPFQPPASG